MDVMEAILTRRSIRKYTAREVSEEIVRDLLRAAMSAPSAHNEQPWHFIVIRDREILDKIPEFHPHAGMLKQTGVAIVVCGDKTLEKSQGFWVQDCAAATQNILLAAHGNGLGAVWVGIYPVKERVEKLRHLLGLPEHVIPFSIIPLGYPAEYKPPEERYREERVRYNHW